MVFLSWFCAGLGRWLLTRLFFLFSTVVPWVTILLAGAELLLWPCASLAGKGRLVVPEEKAIGRVDFAAIALFLKAVGGPAMWLGFVAIFWLATLFDVAKTWYIGYWSSQYEGREPSDVNSSK